MQTILNFSVAETDIFKQKTPKIYIKNPFLGDFLNNLSENVATILNQFI